MIIQPSTSSGSLGATALIMSIPCRLCSIDILPPATGTASLIVYDNNTSSSTSALVLCQIYISASSTQSVNFDLSTPRAANKGLYAVLTGTTTYNLGYQA
jgi:hypothetical protein